MAATAPGETVAAAAMALMAGAAVAARKALATALAPVTILTVANLALGFILCITVLLLSGLLRV